MQSGFHLDTEKPWSFVGVSSWSNCPSFNQEHPAKWGSNVLVFKPGNYLMKIKVNLCVALPIMKRVYVCV